MALTQIDDRGLKTPIDLLDNEKIRLGTGNDLELYHDGSHSSVANSTGNLNLTSAGAVVTKVNTSEDAIVCNANGAVDLYYDNSKKFETNSSGAAVTGDLDINAGSLHLTTDGQRLRLGTGSGGSGDFELYHDGSNAYSTNSTGELKIGSDHIELRNAAQNSTRLASTSAGALELYYNNSKKLETTSAGVKLLGSGTDAIEMTGDVWFNNNEHAGADIYFNSGDKHLIYEDNVKAKFGGAGDLEIYHDGTNSYIDETKNANNLWIRGQANIHMGFGSEKMATFSPNGSVELFYDNTTRVSTATNGFSVKGKSFLAREDGGIGDYTSVRLGFYQSIGASSSHTFQVGSLYAIGTVTIWGSRGAGANNATVATGKIYPIHIRATATAGLGSQIGSDIGGANGGFSYSVAAGGQGITVHNTDNTYAMNTFVTFDLTGFVG